MAVRARPPLVTHIPPPHHTPCRPSPRLAVPSPLASLSQALHLALASRVSPAAASLPRGLARAPELERLMLQPEHAPLLFAEGADARISRRATNPSRRSCSLMKSYLLPRFTTQARHPPLADRRRAHRARLRDHPHRRLQLGAAGRGAPRSAGDGVRQVVQRPLGRRAAHQPEGARRRLLPPGGACRRRATGHVLDMSRRSSPTPTTGGAPTRRRGPRHTHSLALFHRCAGRTRCSGSLQDSSRRRTLPKPFLHSLPNFTSFF